MISLERRHRVPLIVTIIVSAAVGALLVVGYLHLAGEGISDEKEGRAKSGIAVLSRVSAANGEVVVSLDSEALSHAGIVTAVLSPVIRTDQQTAFGTVLAVGDLITFSANYTAAKTARDKADGHLAASHREYMRLQTLNQDDKNISDKMLQSAEAVWRSDAADAANAASSLKAAESALREQWGDVIAGWVAGPSPQLARLFDQKNFLVQVTLPPRLGTAVAPETALLEPPGWTGQARLGSSGGGSSGKSALLEARLVSPARRTDPRIQGRSFFYIAPAEGGLLPGMNVAAHLAIGKDVAGFFVPDSAVVWWQGLPWIYVQIDNGRFVRRALAAEGALDDGWFTPRGLGENERVVIEGAPILLSEEFRSQIDAGELGKPE